MLVVDRAAAEQLWPGQSPVGQWLRGAGDVAPRQVVGVAENVAHQLQFTNQAARPYIYEPLSLESYSRAMTVVVRVADHPEMVLPRRPARRAGRVNPVTILRAD